MIDNYEILKNGVIHQIHSTPFNYGTEYSDNYNKSPYKEMSDMLSCLRFGYLVGSISKIPNSILDVGYGSGSFLKVCSEQIKKCYGYDVSDFPVPEKCLKVDSMFTQYYEVITFFDSLEHFNDISFVKDLLCSSVVISVPWCHNFSDDWFGDWKHRKPDEHLWHFNLTSLINFMSEQGFKFVCYSSIEDNIRKNNLPYENILTATFKKL